MLQLLDNSKIKDFVNFYQQQYTQDVSYVSIIGTLCNPITKHLLKIFVNHLEPTKCTFMVIKIPSWQDVRINYESTKEGYELKDSYEVKEFFYQFWCYDLKTLSPDVVDDALKLCHPPSFICKTEQKLFNLLLSKMEEEPKLLVFCCINVLHFTDNYNENINRDEYDIKPMKMKEFKTNMESFYPTVRFESLEQAILHGTNFGAFCKKSNELAGWVFLNETGSINALQVLPSHCRKGLAKRLVYKMAEYCCQHGIVPHGYAEDVNRSYLKSIGFEQYPDFVIALAFFSK